MFLVGVETTKHCGCRIIHDVSLDTVVLRIHAGVLGDRPARDEPVQFMLTAADVDTLIGHLKTIRAELAASQESCNAIH
jgi:hypothetical protein